MTTGRIKNNLGFLIAGLVIFSVATTVYLEVKQTAEVKKSPTGMCHVKGSLYYSQTLNYKPYSNLEKCLTSGGKVPESIN